MAKYVHFVPQQSQLPHPLLITPGGGHSHRITIAVALYPCIFSHSASFQDLVSHLLVIPQESFSASLLINIYALSHLWPRRQYPQSRSGSRVHRTHAHPIGRHPSDPRRARPHRHRPDRYWQDGGYFAISSTDPLLGEDGRPLILARKVTQYVNPLTGEN